MAASKDPIDRVVDLAFNLPIAGAAFARDATKLALHQIVSSGRDVVAGIATQVVDQRAESDISSRPRSASGNERAAARTARSQPAKGGDVDQPSRDGGGASKPAGVTMAVDELAVEDYDSLNARQVLALIDGLNDDDVSQLLLYESANRGRRTILLALGSRLDR